MDNSIAEEIEANASRCADIHAQNQFISAYVIYGIFYFVLFAFAIFSYLRTKARFVKLSTDMKISRLFIIFMLILKSAVMFTSAILKRKETVKHLSFFMTTFPGYIVDISFCLILITWCNLFLTFVSSNLHCTIKTIKYTSIALTPISVIVFFLTFFVQITVSQTKNILRDFENYFALSVDLILAIIFTAFIVLMFYAMEVRLSCSSFSGDQVVLGLCILAAFGLFVRVVMRIYFQVMISRHSAIDVVCSVGQFVSLVIRELFGQIIPFFFILFTDLFINTNNVQLSFDHSELLDPH